MKNIYSNIIKFNSKNLIKIINILKKNGIIGLPTETVYGLAKPYTVSVGKPIMPFFLRILIILIKFFELNLIIFE